MKPFEALVVMCVVCFSLPLTVLAQSTSQTLDLTTTTFTHTVFAELGTETNCNHCHKAREALDRVYDSHDYPFYYVSLVDDKDAAANARIDDYNIAGYPTVWFDGGTRVEVGGYEGNEADYRTAIQDTGSRSVSDIDLTLEVEWLGNATMDISVAILNHEAGSYTGRLRVYVTEVESTMGWNDTTGHPYTFPLLDYAFNEDIAIPSGGTWSDSLVWDGHDYNDGYGHDFGNIQWGNIEVIAAVFNSQVHQGFSDPPSGSPFDAYWVDDAAGIWLGTQHPPNDPENPNPVNGATNVDVTKDIGWSCSDPDIGDSLTYDLYFGTTNPPGLLAEDLVEPKYDPGRMEFLTQYYWRIVATDCYDNSVEGPLWSFTTSNQYDIIAPTVSLDKPRAGYIYVKDNDGSARLFFDVAFLIGPITITAQASDEQSGVDRVEFLIDGASKATDCVAPFTFFWDEQLLPFKAHTLTVVAYDEAGNDAQQQITVRKFL